MRADSRLRDSRGTSSEMIGVHPTMVALRRDIERAASMDVPVVIEGPTGTGKELVAALLHARSTSRGAFVGVNVAALTDSLVDAELFGVDRGAFTGASAPRPGLLEQADAGTLLLDEAGDLPLTVQAKLLRALETRHVRRLGASVERPASFRLTLTLQRPAEELRESGRWRDDFYFRVAGLVLRVPPLADRLSDVPLLAQHFMRLMNRPPLSEDTLQALQEYSWPGNVRELRRVLERAIFLGSGDGATTEHLKRAMEGMGHKRPAASAAPLRTLHDVEREHIERALAQTGGCTRRTARALSLSVPSLYRRFALLGIVPPRYR